MRPTSPAETETVHRPDTPGSLARQRLAAGSIDLAIVAAPLVAGWLLLGSVGAGQADRAVFGGAAVAAAVALWVWNRGYREGLRGQGFGKARMGLLVRDRTTGGPLGLRAALGPRRTAETVPVAGALDDGFAPRAVDASRAAVRRRRLWGLLGLAALLLLAVLAGIAVGARPLELGQVVHAVFTPSHTETDQLVQTLRIPRTLLGVLVGVALGVAGALIQGHTRNPLADSGLLGLNAGAAFLVVLGIHLWGLTAPGQYLWLAFAGTLIASVVVFAFSSAGGGGPLTLVLAGAAVSFFLQALTNALVLLDPRSLDGYRFWVVGSLAGRGPDVLWQVLPFALVGLALACANTPSLNMLGLGDDMARGLGTNVLASRVVGIAAITLLVGAATAAAGPIAFVGLVAPHVVRTITGPDYRWLVPYAGVVGAIMVLVADVVGRVVARPGELQVGIVLAVLGAPFFIALVRRRKLVGL